MRTRRRYSRGTPYYPQASQLNRANWAAESTQRFVGAKGGFYRAPTNYHVAVEATLPVNRVVQEFSAVTLGELMRPGWPDFEQPDAYDPAVAARELEPFALEHKVDTSKPCGIIQTSISDEGAGARVAMSGMTWARITWSSEDQDDKFADFKDESDLLVGGSSGPIQIVWKDPLGLVKEVFVWIKPLGAGLEMKIVTPIEDVAPNTWADVYEWENIATEPPAQMQTKKDDNGDDVVIKNVWFDWMHMDEQISPDKQCLIARMPGSLATDPENPWRFVGAECEDEILDYK